MLPLLLSVLLLHGCSKGEEPPLLPEGGEQWIGRTDFSTPDNIIAYYKSQLDKETIEKAPETMYREKLSSSEIESERATLWELWKQANAERLERAGMSTTNTGNKPVWKIPQNEQMKVAIFAKGNRPSEGYPMIIQLHGGGAYPETTSAWGSNVNEGEWYESLRLAREYQDAPSLYIVPRMADDRRGRWYYTPQIQAFRRAYQLGVLSGNVNPNRVYLTGISEGGYGSLSLATFMPDYWAAVGPLAAATKPSEQIIGLRNIAFRLEVGERDSDYGRNVYAYQWEEAMEKLRKENPGEFTSEVIIQRGRDHFITYTDMTPWLIRHSRRVNPDHVSYVYHNIAPDAGNGYSTFSQGVYNLDFRKLHPASNKARLQIDVRRNGNTFDITTKEVSEGVTGFLGLYLAQVDFTKPILVRLNGKPVYEKQVIPSRGTMVESISLFGDPERIFAGKIEIRLNK